jgi:D-alanyl-D-alanine carboxypeptidase
MQPMKRFVIATFVVAAMLAGCSSVGPTATPSPTATATAAAARTTQASPSARANHFPTEVFAGLGEEPVSEGLAAKLQEVLETSANGDGLTAALISPAGTWIGATGMASAERAMVPNDQMAIASITKTLVAAQVMQLIEAGQLQLDDLAADRLPPDLEFDTNRATIEDLLSMRSGIPEFFDLSDDEFNAVLTRDRLHVWTTEEKLATVAPGRGTVGQDREWEYIGTNYLLLGLIIEQVTGRSVAEVLRSGILSGDGYERLIYQPDERPTEPMAMPSGASDDLFDDGGGYLPSISSVTMGTTEGAIASDAQSLARWFRNLCAGQVVSQASLDEMTDLNKRPEYGLGIWDRRYQYGPASGALGHTGLVREGYRSAAFCFQDPGLVVVLLANAADHDVETTAGNLVDAARE